MKGRSTGNASWFDPLLANPYIVSHRRLERRISGCGGWWTVDVVDIVDVVDVVDLDRVDVVDGAAAVGAVV